MNRQKRIAKKRLKRKRIVAGLKRFQREGAVASIRKRNKVKTGLLQSLKNSLFKGNGEEKS